MSAKRFLVGSLFIVGFAAATDPVVSRERSITVDDARVLAWNRFAKGLYDAHKTAVSKRPLRKEERVGGYHRRPDYFREESFYDVATGNLVSRVRWVREKPSLMHSIEVYVYDDGGRLSRDYGAYYLPDARNAPVQTLINFHHRENDLHAFRQFDASGERLYEKCRGTWFGEPVSIDIEEPLVATPVSLTTSEAYTACFGFLPSSAGAHVDPAHAILGQQASFGAENDPQDKARRLVRLYTLRLKLAPNRAANYLKRGKAHFELFDFDAAVADFTRALERDETLDEAYFWRGMALGRNKQLDQAEADLTVFIERNPRSSVAYTKRGVRRIWNRNFAGAEKDLNQAVALDPKNAEAHDDLGVLQARRNDHEAAIQSFRTAIHLDRTYEKAHHNLALVLHILGRSSEALISIETALRLGNRTRSSALLKAEILENLGRADEARALRLDAALLPQKNWSENLAVQ